MKLYYETYKQINAKKIKEAKKRYRSDNLERVREIERESKRKYRKKVNEYLKAYNKKRRSNDSMFRLSVCISRRMHETLANSKGKSKYFDLLGYSLQDLKKHLEKHFKLGMTWSNYGKWELDHIVPISAFNYKSTSDLDFRKCWSLSNLQPLWKSENRHKSNKLSRAFQPSLAF
jgi:hypothetical protein